MRISIFAILFGAAMGLAACNGGGSDDSGDSGDTSYEGMRVRAADVGWRLEPVGR